MIEPMQVDINVLRYEEDAITVVLNPCRCDPNFKDKVYPTFEELGTALRKFIQGKYGRYINVLDAEEDSIAVLLTYRDPQDGQLRPVFSGPAEG